MVSTYAQRKAVHTYIDKLKAKGISQHCLYCSDLQWLVLKELIKAVKQMNLDGLQSMEIDDEGKFIKFIYDNRSETHPTDENQSSDDIG